MSNIRLVTKNIGDLRGFSTDSIFIRPPNVAEIAENIQKSPDGTFQIRRGYQCQISNIGGMGIGTFDNPALDFVQTVCIGLDGYLYNKLEKQIFFYYNGQITGSITGISNSNPAVVESVAHGLPTGTKLIIKNVLGMVEVNNLTFTITFVDSNHFSLNGIDSTLYTPYISGGIWSIAFADNRYLTFSIFTDPRYIYNNAGQSITSDTIVNQAAQVNGNQVLTNTIVVQFGHELAAGDVVQFYDVNSVFQQRNILSNTPTSITIDGNPVSLNDGYFINQFVEIIFGKGFDVGSPYTIAQFISALTDPVLGVYGLKIAINGLSNLPAAFLQIIEPIVIDNNLTFKMNYWYWQKVNSTLNNPVLPPFPGSADIKYQNSKDFEIASMTDFDDIIIMANGWDYPQKYDGQTVYRTGMPEGGRPFLITDNNSYPSEPFTMGQVYQYATTYEQIDNKGHIVEGIISEITSHTIGIATAAMNVTLFNLRSSAGNNWNTNGALAVGGEATVYGPDINGFYYDLVDVNTGYTLKIGDTAYYGDLTAAVFTGGVQGPSFVLNVESGFSVLPGDTIYFLDNTNVERQRIVDFVDPVANTITIQGSMVTVNDENVLDYLTGLVFGNVAIVNGNQSNVNIISVNVGYSVEVGDVVDFIDSSNNLQRRNVTSIGAGTITIDGIPVNVSNLFLIYSENQRIDAINIQRTNPNPATLSNGVSGQISNSISNNLRINIYRTNANESFGVNGKLYLVSSIPNDSSGTSKQIYIDGIPDTETLRDFDNPTDLPYPPPISKYVKSFGNQVFYAGGERGNPENSDRVFFSAGNNPESVSLASDFFNVPNMDDDITGLGVAGTTLITTKNLSLWAATGNFLDGNIDVVQIAPGTNIGCVAHATISSVGTLMYFTHSNGVYSITENQLFPTDPFGSPIPLSLAINLIFRFTNYLPQTRYVLKRGVAINYTKDLQYLLFLPCEDIPSSIRTANTYSRIFCYDYEGKNWFKWDNMNAAGGMCIIDDNLYFQERRYSAVNGNTANLYKQHRFYRLVDHADHAGAQYAEWRSSWVDLGQPEIRKKFSRCILLLDRISDLLQFNNPIMEFSSYLNRIPDLQNTIATIFQTDQTRNAGWSTSPWGWGMWSGYQDSFVTIELKQGTVAKSIQVGFTIKGINMDIGLAGFQVETIPENRKTVLR